MQLDNNKVSKRLSKTVIWCTQLTGVHQKRKKKTNDIDIYTMNFCVKSVFNRTKSLYSITAISN